MWTTLGLALTVAGCGWALASLWYPWAVDGPHAGVAADLDGWQTMAIGDTLLVITLAAILSLVGVLCLAGPSERTTLVAGIGALSLIAMAAAGATLVWWLLGWDFVVMDDSDLRKYGRGGGARRAVTGLGIAAAGVACAMRSRRWDASPGNDATTIGEPQ